MISHDHIVNGQFIQLADSAAISKLKLPKDIHRALMAINKLRDGTLTAARLKQKLNDELLEGLLYDLDYRFSPRLKEAIESYQPVKDRIEKAHYRLTRGRREPTRRYIKTLQAGKAHEAFIRYGRLVMAARECNNISDEMSELPKVAIDKLFDLAQHEAMEAAAFRLSDKIEAESRKHKVMAAPEIHEANPQEKLFTINETAKILNVLPGRVYQLRIAGTLKRDGSLITASSIELYSKTRRQRTTSESMDVIAAKTARRRTNNYAGRIWHCSSPTCPWEGPEPNPFECPKCTKDLQPGKRHHRKP